MLTNISSLQIHFGSSLENLVASHGYCCVRENVQTDDSQSRHGAWIYGAWLCYL
jgi:hypothetical protein